MKTPLWDTYLSNKDFDDIKDFENVNLKIERVNDHIEISFKLTYSPNMFIYNDGTYYYICVNYNTLVNAGFEQDKLFREKNFFNKLYLYRNSYVFDKFIERPKMFVYPKGKNKYLNIIKSWVKRYTQIIKNIDPDDIRLEVSGGMDTRILSYFWRYNPVNYTVYTKSNSDETEIAKNVINYISDNFPCNLTITHDKDATKKYELNGGNIIHGLFIKTTKKDFQEVIGNSMVSNKSKHIVKGICPFYDKELLQLKGDYAGEVKLILFYLLCNDKHLYKLPIRSFTGCKFNFTDDIINFLRLKRFMTKDIKVAEDYFTKLK